MADSGSSNSSNNAPLCANNCGFYGNPKNQNLCSVCYAAFLKESGQDSTSNDVVQSKIGTELAGVRDEEENLRSEGSTPSSESSDASESVADLSFNKAPEIAMRTKIEFQQEIDPKPTMDDSGTSINGGDAPLCANNCGFYSNPKNRNLCSACYAAFLKESGEVSTSNDVARSQIGTGIAGVRDEEENLRSEGSTSESAAKTKNRCKICKKKVGLLGFNCRCGDLFCGKHRYPETHLCDVDHKTIGREVLKKQVVECKADKLEFRV